MSGSPDAKSPSRSRIQIVAKDERDLHAIGDAKLFCESFDRGAAGEGIDASGVGDDADAALDARRQHIAKMREEIGRISRFRLAGALLLQNRHRDFGEVVHDEVVDRSTFDLPARRRRVVAPESAAIGDDRSLHLNSSRAITIRCTSDVPSPISHNLASR